jgi:hypothetical protein
VSYVSLLGIVFFVPRKKGSKFYFLIDVQQPALYYRYLHLSVKDVSPNYDCSQYSPL